MSAKWRALQHRHQYTYTAVIFPQSYTENLNNLPLDIASFRFFTELKELISLNSIYAQVNAVKKVATAFGELLGNSSSSNGEIVVNQAILRFYLEIFFVENSLPLHRTLLGVLVKIRDYKNVIGSCLQLLCDEYGSLGKGRRFVLSRVALSMMSYPKLGFLLEIVEECSVKFALDATFGLRDVAVEVNNGSRPSPVAMEQCQEALSCLYYLLQRFPAKFSKDFNLGEMIMGAMISVLRSASFSRDSLVAAGVGFCAVLQLCLTLEELGYFIVKSFFRHASIDTDVFVGVEQKLPWKGDLYVEIGNFSVLSRLCLLRGILTSVPRAILGTRYDFSADSIDCLGADKSRRNTVWTILFDGILPELCVYCENPVDSHFNFHVLTVLQICFQQIKTILSANIFNVSEDYDPLPEGMGSRILKIIWNNLDDTLNQTVKQVHLIFDLFLDVRSTLSSPENSDRTKSFLIKTASDLLKLGPRCKGRYVPLASITKRLGAKTVLSMNPDLLFETMYAYIDDDVCCASTSFLKCFLECLRDECWSSDGVESGYMSFREHCLPPIMNGLVSGISKLRSNLNTYALPVLLAVDVDSVFLMLDFISVKQNREENEVSCTGLAGAKLDLSVDQQVAALVSLLKVSRSLALVEGDIEYEKSSIFQEIDMRTENRDLFALLCMKGIKFKVPVKWLVLALTHVDETLRVDAAESLFLNPKTSSLPSHLELGLLKEAVPLNMRCCSTAFQMKWTSLFRKFFSRVRTALEKQFKQGSWKLLTCTESEEEDTNKSRNEFFPDRAKDLFQFMRWFSCFLFFSCYPSAPYERKIMAMELILIMINVWPIVPPSNENCNSTPVSTLYPYGEGFTSPDSTLLLVGSIIDSWDKLRENSFCILLHFPTPLPGISSEERVREVITWAKKLVCSPRVRESDAGALCLRLIFRKYVLELEWIVGASVNVICFRSHSELLNGATQLPKSKIPVIEYILSLIDWLDVAVTAGEKDLSEACRNSFVHGVLLALRYTFEELDWNSDVVISSSSEMRNAIERLLDLVKRITDLALWVVAADAWHLPEDMEDMVGEDALLSDISVETAENISSSELQTTNSKSVDASAGPSDQVVMVGCWLAMKEVSLLLGTITKKTPLPTCSSSDSSKTEKYILEGCENVSMVASDEILNLRQLESIGNHFLEVLLKMKHNGAIDKTRAGFTALCNRLLCSNDPRLCEMTESWMDQLMERTIAKGQTVDDLLRRSAGIPAGFIALFLSEPEGTPKKLLPRAMRWLLDVANTSLPNPVESNHQTGGLAEQSVKLNQTPISTKTIEIDGNEKNSKSRHEGVIPTVHAFNVLRASFNDANLGTDTSGFSAEALIMSIRAFSSQYWEVRNSACLAYTALLRRMVGFLNVQKRESARRALTAVEFFHRYPTLHPFLFHELKVATELLGDGTSRKLESNISKVVHPSLFPVLILLARLKPSMISCETEDPLDPFLFMPFIRRCSTQSNLRVRVLASRALLGLISNEKLGTVLLNIASGLPHTRNETSFNSIHGILLQVCSLLDVNCRNLSDISKKEQILGNLIDLLKKCSWIGNPKSCPCSTLNTSFLHVLDHILGIVRTCPITQHIDTIRNLLLKSSSECLDSDSFSESPFHDPTKPELRKQAAGSYFNCVFQANTVLAEQSYQFLQIPSDSLKVCELEKEIDGVTERLMISLSDSLYEVRIATLKWLLRFLKSDGIHGYRIYKWAERNLQPLLVELLAKEVHPRCVCYILRVIFTWNSLQFKNSSSVGAMDCDSVLDLWDRLMALNEVVRHTKAKEALLCCMGICVKRLSVLFKNDESAGKLRRIYGCISIFVDLIQEYSAASEPVNMRDAAATSMVASGLLGEAPYISSLVIKNAESTSEDTVNLYSCRILELWFTCIKLLEDEDIGIREMLAKDVQKYFSVGETSTQVEKVIEMSFEFLSSLFSHWITYYDYLAKRVLDTSIYVVSQGDLVRRVFDKEIDNHHEEKILISQICCVHLEKIPSELEAAVTSLQKWRLRFYKQFILFANGYLRGGVGINWIGGPGNHRDVFVSIYANLLGFFATSRTLFNRCDEISEPGLSDILDLEETIRSFLGNPLICNLFLVVVRDHKIKCGDASWNSDVWPGFDPYFLLR